MSTPLAAVIVIAFLIVVLPAAHRIILRRNRAHDAKRDRIIRESLEEPDPRWGTNLADHDTCVLIWDMDAYDPELDAGCDRLWDAIDEHREEGGT